MRYALVRREVRVGCVKYGYAELCGVVMGMRRFND